MSNDSDNKNLPQVRANTNIALASKQLATVNKALTTINREKFIKFLERNKNAAEFFINHISQYSNVLDMDLIDQHGDQLNWLYLSSNESLPWSEALIERYKDKWDWENLSSNDSLPSSEELLEPFADKWQWECLDWGYPERDVDFYKEFGAGKVFNSWTKQEISTALERIRSAHKDLPHV